MLRDLAAGESFDPKIGAGPTLGQAQSAALAITPDYRVFIENSTLSIAQGLHAMPWGLIPDPIRGV
jgi:hypothetical protein